MSERADATNSPFGVYIHVPYCLSKCPYCDFASEPLREGRDDGAIERYARLVEGEIGLAVARFPELADRPMRSLYLGGGTPSLLEPRIVARWIEALREVFPSAGPREYPDWEATLECNPAPGATEHLPTMRAAGINRVSLGVQSFSDVSLRALGRAHTADEARRAIGAVKASGFASWGLDLIFAIPGSSRDDLRRDLEEAVAHGAPHLSVYGLTLHEGTAMHAAWRCGEMMPVDEETQREMFLDVRGFLTERGYHHYEISNYALPGHEARHNAAYWVGTDYLGLGAAAHGYVEARRYWNPASVEDYAGKVVAGKWPGEEEGQVSVRSRRGEAAMLALRNLDGVSLAALSRRMGCDAMEEYGREIDRLRRAGLLCASEGRISLTEEGMLLSDTVFEAFF